ncbi:glycosyltransferase family 2 protein [Tritonibacter mobilis]|uniref:glycosyltransferase family 2 protein n=1 Tax=Tritonibacter mobilis TaxID=379347 RepID=UPI001CD94D96|nr:cellulose synthase catalytic subunit [Tritonibacter mobilis]MCA2009343.1 glycosyltransferase [Tritonibacter mobilis]
MQNPHDLSHQPFRRPVLQGRLRRKYLALALLWLIAAMFFWQWWLRPDHYTSWYLYWPVTLCVFWVFFVQAYLLVFFLRAQHATGSLAALGPHRVAMVVTKAPSEPFDVVRVTLQAMLAQDVPHDTWLADEDPDQETLEWCARHGVQVSTRKGVEDYHQKTWPRRTRCKEGNLAYFYDHYGYDRYDFVSQLDADHVPQPNYLKEILRAFVDPDVGYVSAPSICSQNSANSWAARSRLHNEAIFHGVVQAGYANGWAPMCIGSHYAVRTKALREIGGLGPELAEDHSTSMMMNAGGWRGMHALDAIALGDGPETFVDLIVQEFQWSRSLMTIFLQYTPRYFANLSVRQRFQFVFCQLWYPLMASFMAMMYAFPVIALVFDVRYININFPAFLLFVAPSALALMALVWNVRSDGLFRPYDAKVFGWEKLAFCFSQWPWVLRGNAAAIRDSLSGGFVDFRVTPKGSATVAAIPWVVLIPYLVLALTSLIPVLLIDDISDAAGFYIFALINAFIYTALFAVIALRHLIENEAWIFRWPMRTSLQLGCMAVLSASVVFGLVDRSNAAFGALTETNGTVNIYKRQFPVSGAGQNAEGRAVLTYNPDWYSQLLNSLISQRTGK